MDSLAKDYKWLWEKLAVEANDQTMNDSFEDSLSRGDVPRLPDHHVRREILVSRESIYILFLKAEKLCITLAIYRLH